MAAVATAIAVGALLLIADSDEEEQAGAPALSYERLPHGGVRGCRERVEGGRFPVKQGRDTVIGPVTWPYARSNFRAGLRSKDLSTKQRLPPGLREFPFKLLALVESGVRATLVVPADQRTWMRVFYSSHESGDYVVTLRACRRFRSRAAQERECHWAPLTACSWINTQFNGGVYIDFDHAPRLGRCAELIVRVRDGREFRGRLFRPSPADCPRSGVS
jgi:hypothetical protein